MLDSLFAIMSPIEIVATVFGLTSVWLTVKRNIWCWPTGIVMVILYIWIFGNARLYSDAGLQVIYVFLQIYGWWHWTRGAGPQEDDELPVTRLGGNGRIAVAVTAIVATGGLGFLMDNYTNADLAYPDATTTVLSLLAQWLMARKVLESWMLWITVDVLSVGIYFAKGLYVTCGLYAVFLILASKGLIEWRKAELSPAPA